MERIITKSFARLMGRGVHRGFITYEELNKSLGKRKLTADNLEQAFIHIIDENIVLQFLTNRLFRKQFYSFFDFSTVNIATNTAY